jgi:hypothetical protein
VNIDILQCGITYSNAPELSRQCANFSWDSKTDPLSCTLPCRGGCLCKGLQLILDTHVIQLCILQVNFGAAAAAVFTAAVLVASPVFAAEGDVKVRGLLCSSPQAQQCIVIRMQLLCRHHIISPCLEWDLPGCCALAVTVTACRG